MALKQMSQHTIQARLAIGEKNASSGYPVKLDHFIATYPYDPKTKLAKRHPKLMEYLKSKYNTDKTKIVDVVLVDHHPEEVFYTDYMNYPSTTCNCRGNGELAIRTDDKGGKSQVVCNYDTCEFRQKKTNKGIINTCKPTGILTFIIPDAPMAGGVIKFVTHSMMTISKINGALEKIYSIRKTLQFLKVRLKVQMVSVNVNGVTQNVPTVELEIPYSYNEIGSGSGTVIGNLTELQSQHLALGSKPDPQKMQELSISAEKDGFIDLDIPKDENIQNGQEKTIDAEIVKSGEDNNDSSNNSEFDF